MHFSIVVNKQSPPSPPSPPLFLVQGHDGQNLQLFKKFSVPLRVRDRPVMKRLVPEGAQTFLTGHLNLYGILGTLGDRIY